MLLKVLLSLSVMIYIVLNWVENIEEKELVSIQVFK